MTVSPRLAALILTTVGLLWLLPLAWLAIATRGGKP